jgi:hypothetical protein
MPPPKQAEVEVTFGILSISPIQAVFERRLRKYRTEPLRRRMEEIAEAFLAGYYAALEEDAPAEVARRLASVEPERRGFAAEGVGMGLALLDSLTPWRRDRLQTFAQGPGREQSYMLHVGAGWALAWPLASPRQMLARLDPVLRWMTLDGFGFYASFFRWRRTVVGQLYPRRLGGRGREVFDIGIGRRLWFLDDPGIGHTLDAVAAFPPARRSALWSGLGEACAFGGGRDESALTALRQAAGPYLPDLAQGVAFSAEVRAQGGNPAPHTELACRTICGMSAKEAATIVQDTASALPPEGELLGLAVWRLGVQQRFGALRGL